MPLENRNLEPGTVLAARYKGERRTCEVVQTDDGLRYRLDDGTEHKSPSSAGKAAMGGIACNGWRFWSVEGSEPQPRERKAKPAKKAAVKPKSAKKAAKKAAKKGKAKSQRAASRGSYGCGVCGEEFPTMKAATDHASEKHVT